MTPTRLVVVGDEAWFGPDWDRRLARNAASTNWYRARKAGATYASPPPRAAAGLHELRCSGPTRATGCSCVKIPMYRELA